MKSITVVVIKFVEPGALSNECLRFIAMPYHMGLRGWATCRQVAPI
jgi:hypothetical protein